MNLHWHSLLRTVSSITFFVCLSFFVVSLFSRPATLVSHAQTSVKCDGWANPGETHCNTSSCQQFYCNSAGNWESRGGGGVCQSQAACSSTTPSNPGNTGNSNTGFNQTACSNWCSTNKGAQNGGQVGGRNVSGKSDGNITGCECYCQQGAWNGSYSACVGSGSTGGTNTGAACSGTQVDITGYGSHTLTASIKSGQSCSAYAYVKKNTCNGNVSVCNQNEQTIAQGNLPISGTASPSCGQTVQIDIDVYQSAPWANHIAGGGTAVYGGDCAQPTPTPTPIPTATPIPTSVPGVCNSLCSSNANCTTGLSCIIVNGTTEKRCRLATNSTSTTCSQPTPTPTCSPTPRPTPGTCNSSCFSNNDCVSGLVCEWNHCRLQANPSSTTCAQPTPTPTASPTPTPTATPKPTGKFRICKFEDRNADRVQNNGEPGLSWSFTYKLNNGSETSYQTTGRSWYQFWRDSGCGDWVTVDPDTQVWVKEASKDGWEATTDSTQTAIVRSGSKTELLFGNRQKNQPTPTPSPTATPRSCNNSCVSSSDCQSGLTCYQDGNSKYCRHPDNPTNSSCDTRKTGGFFIRKYNDENGNGYQDNGEKGLSWKFQWDSNGDNNWHDYETFENSLGEGGVVSLPVDTQVRIREKSVDGWTATTPTEVTIHITAGNNQMMVFGNWRGKPQVLGVSTPTKLPSTGFTSFFGAIGSVAMYGTSIWLKKRGL